MKSPAFTLKFALVALVALPASLPAAESFRFFTRNNATLTSNTRPVFYISGTIYNDANNSGRFDPKDKAASPSSLTLYRLVDGQWRPVNARPQRTSAVGAFTFAVFVRGTYRLGIKYDNSPVGAYSFVKGFGTKAASGSRIRMDLPFVTASTASRYRMTTTRTPHSPPVSATPIR